MSRAASSRRKSPSSHAIENWQTTAIAHPFSIASGPERPYLEFAARRSASDFKRAFFTLQAGDEVEILGPKGRFFLEEDAPAVLVAGGIGITPMKGMLEHAADAGLFTRITLLYGSHTPGEIAFREAIDEMAHRKPRARIVYTVSEPDAGWTGRFRRLGPELIVPKTVQRRVHTPPTVPAEHAAPQGVSAGWTSRQAQATTS